MVNNLRCKKRGFALLEVLIVAVIISLLAALVVPRVIEHLRKAQEAEATQNLGSIRSAELLLQQLSGKFVEAADHPAIQAALGLVIEGRFYTYKIIDASADNFLAVATPVEPFNNWLEEKVIDKDGFGDTGYGSGGSSGGGSGGSSGGGSGGSGVVVPPSGGTDIKDYSGPAFVGYTSDILEVFDTLALATAGLDAEGAVSGATLKNWLTTNNIPVLFETQPPEEINGKKYITWGYYDPNLNTIVLNNYHQNTKYVYASILAHETLHAIWEYDYNQYLAGTPGYPQLGTPPQEWQDEYGPIRSDYSIDNEYNAKLTGYQIYYQLNLTSSGDKDPYNYNSNAYQFIDGNGVPKDENAAKTYLRTIPSYQSLPAY